jgi:muramoyltetrapeptide carboxypeptidase
MFNKIENEATIGILSPAWIPLSERLTNGINYLQQLGYNIKLSKNLKKKYGYFAGTDEERVEDIHEMFSDKEISVLLATRGGWGTLRYLDKLDYGMIEKNPKPIIGYSDITSLQLAVWAKTGVGSISGPMCAVEMGKGIKEFTEKHFWGYIHNTARQYAIDLSETKSKFMIDGVAEGTLLGGCLSLVSFLMGTPFCPDYNGAVLFLEDVGEQPYKIDRYLAHLKQCGVFNKISALILGDFLDCEDEEKEDTFTIQSILTDYFSNAQYPVIYNFPYGHGDLKISMPIGARTTIDTQNKAIKFENLFKN